MNRKQATSRLAVCAIAMIGTISCFAEPVRVRDGFGGPWGYLDEELNLLIEPQFEYATEFDSGIAVVQDGDEGPHFIIDRTGEHIARIEADGVRNPSDGMIAFNLGRTGGYYDYHGNRRLQGYTNTWDFSEGKAFVTRNGEGYFIDRDGTRLFPPLTLDRGYEFHDGLAVVRVKPPNSSETRYGMIDESGAWVIDPRYSFLGEFSEGIAVAGFGEKSYGYIDREERIVIEPQFTAARPFRNATAFVTREEGPRFAYPAHWELIDRDGNIVNALETDIRL